MQRTLIFYFQYKFNWPNEKIAKVKIYFKNDIKLTTFEKRKRTDSYPFFFKFSYFYSFQAKINRFFLKKREFLKNRSFDTSWYFVNSARLVYRARNPAKEFTLTTPSPDAGRAHPKTAQSSSIFAENQQLITQSVGEKHEMQDPNQKDYVENYPLCTKCISG